MQTIKLNVLVDRGYITNNDTLEYFQKALNSKIKGYKVDILKVEDDIRKWDNSECLNLHIETNCHLIGGLVETIINMFNRRKQYFKKYQ